MLYMHIIAMGINVKRKTEKFQMYGFTGVASKQNAQIFSKMKNYNDTISQTGLEKYFLSH